jgi:predicted RND superfamily exporter protein
LSEVIARILSASARRPGIALFAALILSLISVYGVTRLQPDARAELLVDSSSPQRAAQATLARDFGADPVVIVLSDRKRGALLTAAHMVALARLEGSLKAQPGVSRVYGPGTLVNVAATVVTQRALQLCGAAGNAAAEQQCAQQLAQQYPTLGVPALDNEAFFHELLLEPGGQRVRPYWTWALPDPDHAVVSARLAPDATLGQVQALIDAARRQIAGGDLRDLDAAISGTPALAASLAATVTDSLRVLLPVALLAMFLVTFAVLRVPLRLLAVPVGALACLWAAGAAGLVGLALTPATLSVLPVVLGLGTDYALQLANRLSEEGGARGTRVVGAARSVLPSTGLAALATIAGVSAFALSPVPLVRQFGLFLAVGVVCAYLASAILAVPLLGILAERPQSPPPSWTVVARAGRAPVIAGAVISLLGLAGWAALPRVQVQTDLNTLLPPSAAALSDARTVQHAVGLVGELDIVVQAPDTTSAAVRTWMDSAAATALRAGEGDLQPVQSLNSLLAAFNRGQQPDPGLTRRILSAVPDYLSGAVVTADHRAALLLFGVRRVLTGQEDSALVGRLSALPKAPPDARARLAGVPVLAAAAFGSLQGEQVPLNLLAVALVIAVLLGAYRSPLTATAAALPAVSAAGWATGAEFVLRLQPSPITLLLSGVVVAFATEFAVLWLGRFRSERDAGLSVPDASDVASRRVGPAITASALALMLGFGVLSLSAVPLVREFGLAGAGIMVLATGGVLVVLPPLARSLAGASGPAR